MSTELCSLIVRRAGWNAKPPAKREPMETPVPFVILHHTAGTRCHEYEKSRETVRNIQDNHMNDKKWDDIGYTFLVSEDGKVYEGRGWDTVGAHCPGYNSKSIGISIMGNFSDVKPDMDTINAVQVLIECAVTRGKLTADYTLYGHRQARKGTECPGDALFEEIQSWSHWKPGDHFPPS